MYAGKSIDKAFDEQNHSGAAFFVMNQLPIFGRVKDLNPSRERVQAAVQAFEGKHQFDYSKGMVW